MNCFQLSCIALLSSLEAVSYAGLACAVKSGAATSTLAELSPPGL